MIDRCIVATIHLLIALAQFKSRDPSEQPSNLFKPDVREQTRIRNWEGVLRWPPAQRVGCFVAVLIGIALGGAFLWYNLR